MKLLRCCDAFDFLDSQPSNSIDAIIADFPYAKKYLYLYVGVAKRAARVLKPGGSYLCIIPQYLLPDVVKGVNPYLKWRWINSMWQEEGKHPRMAMGIEVMWKPIGWWIKGTWPHGRGFVRDGFANTPPDKAHHVWEQSTDWADFCLKFVPSGGVVCDPAMGAGTVGIQALRKGYSFLGCDIDPFSFSIAEERMKDYD